MENWKKIARESQKMPRGLWNIWVVLGGRGFGKTRTGSEAVRQWVISGEKKRIAIIGPCLEDIRNIMLEGPSGLLSISFPEDNIRYIPSKNLIIWGNGAKAYLVSAYNPQKLRGLQFDGVWIDEFVKMRNTRNLWMQVVFSLRMGPQPQTIITTTPSMEHTLIKILSYEGCIKTGGTTYENASNLSKQFLDFIKSEYQGTLVERQEILGEMVSEDVFWIKEDINCKKIDLCHHKSCYCSFDYLTVGVDPSVNGYYTDTGMIIAGVKDKKIYILQDISCGGGVEVWLPILKKACIDYNIRNIAIETNQGGSMLEYIINNNIPTVQVHKCFAKNAKENRARILTSLYKKKEIFHWEEMQELEKQMINYHRIEKKDRVDALIWAVYHLLKNYNIQKRSKIMVIGDEL